MFYNVVDWFMMLEDPNMAQAGLVSVVTGAGAAWFGLYVNSGSGKNVVVTTESKTQSQGTTMGTMSKYQDEEGY